MRQNCASTSKNPTTFEDITFSKDDRTKASSRSVNDLADSVTPAVMQALNTERVLFSMHPLNRVESSRVLLYNDACNNALRPQWMLTVGSFSSVLTHWAQSTVGL